MFQFKMAIKGVIGIDQPLSKQEKKKGGNENNAKRTFFFKLYFICK